MRRFTEEELVRANSVDIVELAQSRGHAIQREGSQYRLVEHDSLKITGNRWYWHSRKIGGKAVDFLVKYENMSFVDAVHLLLGEEIQRSFRRSDASTAKPVPKELKLPRPAAQHDEAIAYLRGRGLPMDLIQQYIDEIRIYQADTYWRRKDDGSFEEVPGKQVVFVGYDETYTPRYGCARSIQGIGKFDSYGSDKSYAFSLPPQDENCKVLWVFESPIDALSHAAISCLSSSNPWPAHRISLGGLSPLALNRYLEEHPQIRYINLGLDNDEPGNRAAAEIASSLADRYAVYRHPPKHGKDYNDELLFRLRNRSRDAER